MNFFIALYLGTSVGGNDIVAFFDVGVVNHKAISGLTLHSGHSYYATVKGLYVTVSLKNIYALSIVYFTIKYCIVNMVIFSI